MTIMDQLRQLFGSKLDEDLDDSLDDGGDGSDSGTGQGGKSGTADGVKNDTTGNDDKKKGSSSTTPDKNKNDSNVDDKTAKKEENDMAIFSEGWYDAATGKVDESKISNEEVLNAIKTLQTTYENEKKQRIISDSINTELENYSLGVSKDMLIKVLDTSGIKIGKDGKVEGVKEAIDALKTSEPGFFKDKDKESNPLNEGFNPVEKHNSDNVNSFSEAFRLMEEIN